MVWCPVLRLRKVCFGLYDLKDNVLSFTTPSMAIKQATAERKRTDLSLATTTKVSSKSTLPFACILVQST